MLRWERLSPFSSCSVSRKGRQLDKPIRAVKFSQPEIFSLIPHVFIVLRCGQAINFANSVYFSNLILRTKLWVTLWFLFYKGKKKIVLEEVKWLVAKKWQNLYLNLQWFDTFMEPGEGLARVDSCVSSWSVPHVVCFWQSGNIVLGICITLYKCREWIRGRRLKQKGKLVDFYISARER